MRKHIWLNLGGLGILIALRRIPVLAAHRRAGGAGDIEDVVT